MLRQPCPLWNFRARVLPSLTVGIALLVLAPAAPAHAQLISGDLVVRVVDNGDLIVPGAAMVLTDVETGVTHEAVSDDQGTYLFGQLKPGFYRLKVGSSGFKDTIVNDIRIQVGQRAST
jgi:hypothetical protein